MDKIMEITTITQKLIMEMPKQQKKLKKKKE